MLLERVLEFLLWASDAERVKNEAKSVGYCSVSDGLVLANPDISGCIHGYNRSGMLYIRAIVFPHGPIGTKEEWVWVVPLGMDIVYGRLLRLFMGK